MTRLAVFQSTGVDDDGERTYERVGSGALFIGGEFGRGVVSIFLDREIADRRLFIGEDVPRDDDRWIPQIDPSLTRDDIETMRGALRARASALAEEAATRDEPDPERVAVSKLLGRLEGFNGPAILITK